MAEKDGGGGMISNVYMKHAKVSLERPKRLTGLELLRSSSLCRSCLGSAFFHSCYTEWRPCDETGNTAQ